MLGKIEWDVKKIYVNGTITVNDKSEFVIPTKKNQILFVSMKSGKVVRQIDLPVSTKDESISGIVIINDNIFVGFSDGWVYKIAAKKKVGKLFRDGKAPIVSLEEVNGNCLVTDYDGNFTLLNLSTK